MPPPTRANSAMDEAPNAKPVSGWKSWNSRYSRASMARLIPTTVMPMTAPELNAPRSAALRPVRALAAVRTLARTAMYMPTQPAVADAVPPSTYASAVRGNPVYWPRSATPSAANLPVTSKSTNTAISAPTTATKPARNVYSRRRNAAAPCWISTAMCCMASVPGSSRSTRRAATTAKSSASIPEKSASASSVTSALVLVVLDAEVRDLLLAPQPAQRVLELGLLDEQVVLGLEPGGGHGALEVERQPLLDALHARALRQVREQRQVEHDGRRQDAVAAQEGHLALHRVAHPPEDVDVVPALLGVAARRIVVDPHLVEDVAVEVRVLARLEDVLQHTQLRLLLGLE